MTKIAINGLGRVGRAVLKQLVEDGTFELVAVNDLASAEEVAYLLKHDSVYGRYVRDVRAENGHLVVGGPSYVALNEKNVDKLPWSSLAVDIVLECTGVFTRQAELERHVKAGAKHVILSAPIEGGDIPTIVHGVNRANEGATIISCASCTTNCITPVNRDPRPPARCSESDHDNGPRVYGEPGTRRPARQGPPPRTRSGHKPGPVDEWGCEGHDPRAPRIPGEVRWPGGSCSSTRRVHRRHRVPGRAADQC